MAKIEIDEIATSITKFEPFSNDINNMYEGICIEWQSNIGPGQYTIYKKHGSNTWHANSECIDSNADKSLLEALLKQFISSIVVDG